MRAKPQPAFWTGNERICWLCVVMEEFVGVQSLEYAPVVMSGMESVYNAPILESARQAIFNLRQMSLNYATKNSLEYAVAIYNDHHYRNGTQGVYEIDSETLQFCRTDFLEDSNITKAREILAAPIDYKFHGRTVANPQQQMAISLGDRATSTRLPISPITAPLAERRTHNLNRQPRGSISIPIEELYQIAEEMDRKDREHPERRSGNWTTRLRHFEIKVPAADEGLRIEQATIELSGIKHLIGLPGAGKTTILMASGVWLGRKGYKVMLVFPSIEVARKYMADLMFYGVKVGMLVGQNPTTRRSHSDRIAETIAASGGQGGFAYTLDGADSFAFNCLLPAFSTAETSLWGYGYAPCDKIQQSSPQGKIKEYLCPLWTMCGRNKAPRDLIDADIWVGHIRSIDTNVPYQAIDEEIRYFELMARTFDLVIFDEADMVQSNLDEYGVAKLNLSGADDSIHRIILEQVHNPLARNKTYLLADRTIELYSRNMAEFGNHNTSLVSLLQNIHPRLKKRFEGKLLTVSRIITEILEGFEENKAYCKRDRANTAEIQQGFTKTHALRDFWSTAAYTAFYDRIGTETPKKSLKQDLCSRTLGIDKNQLDANWKELIGLFRRYLAENLVKKRDDILKKIANLFLNICFPNSQPPHLTRDAIPLLVGITWVILGYQRTVPETRTMVAEGLIKEPIVNPPLSDQLRRFTPENLIGLLSGVKYNFKNAGTNRNNSSNVTLSYITFVGAPRMLMHRFDRLLEADGRKDAPAILMTSATSYLEASPAYHIDVYPNYLLKPKLEEKKAEIEPSKYYFQCFKDKERSNEPLRYSGAGELRNRNLLKMVDELVKNGDLSEVNKAIRNFDVRDGIRRKAAFVVNSYQQVRDIKEYLDRNYREIGRRTKAVVRYLKEGEKPSDYVTTSQCEALGDDDTCDLIIFAMVTIGRGVNIVFTKGARKRDAAIGSIYFLTRPHPTTDDTQLLYSLAGRATQEFDHVTFSSAFGLTEIYQTWNEARANIYRDTRRLLQEPLMASRLGAELFKPFTANQMVAILQTIGRGMRNACPVSVYFVDAAWAPQSARGKPDSPRDSMLVQMRVILEECVTHPDSTIREIYQELYGAFLEPLRRIDKVIYPANLFKSEDSVYKDDDFEDYDPLYDM
ncbi:MAG: hypothetical protein QNJ70_31070 [Xenococcaceae cyanobacterium MO_207.B15]|nr:hypothetical protein [Xenococcaceae cyanobacterium MO_207.B15]